MLKSYVSGQASIELGKMIKFSLGLFLFLKQGTGPYDKQIKKTEEDVQSILKRVNELAGIKESDTGLAPPALWDLAADKQILSCKCSPQFFEN